MLSISTHNSSLSIVAWTTLWLDRIIMMYIRGKCISYDVNYKLFTPIMRWISGFSTFRSRQDGRHFPGDASILSYSMHKKHESVKLSLRLALSVSVAFSLITVTSWWARWRRKSPASRLFTQPFIQTQIKETTQLRVTGLCEGNSTVTGEFPTQRASNAEIFPFDDVIMYSCTKHSISVLQLWADKS